TLEESGCKGGTGQRAGFAAERSVRRAASPRAGHARRQQRRPPTGAAKLSIAAGKESLDLAKKNTAAEQRKYELGQGTIFLVLEAQTEEATAEQTLLQAQVGYQLAVARLDHATGELLDPYHVQIAELAH